MSPKRFVANLVVLVVLGLQLSAVQADVSHLTDYSSSQLGSYHYPAPRGSLRLPVQQQQQQLVRQFVEPALEHAAFTQVLTSRGYVFGGGSSSSSSTVNTAAASASAPLIAAGRSIGGSASDANSLNLKLPVPFGLMPLNVANLPLQAGASYATVPRTTGLTSYGTAQIQRR